MNYTNLKKCPYFRKSGAGEGETFFPASNRLPNGMEQYTIMLKHEEQEYRILAISRIKSADEIVVHTTEGMFRFPLRIEFRVNVYGFHLFVSG